MFCKYCGQQNLDNAITCGSCGKSIQPAQPGAVAPQQVPSYLVYSILVTLFCCLPFGVVAIVYAAQVSGKLAAGDVAGAVQSSNSARTWCWVSFGVGLVAIVAAVALQVIGIAASGGLQ